MNRLHTTLSMSLQHFMGISRRMEKMTEQQRRHFLSADTKPCEGYKRTCTERAIMGALCDMCYPLKMKDRFDEEMKNGKEWYATDFSEHDIHIHCRSCRFKYDAVVRSHDLGCCVQRNCGAALAYWGGNLDMANTIATDIEYI